MNEIVPVVQAELSGKIRTETRVLHIGTRVVRVVEIPPSLYNREEV